MLTFFTVSLRLGCQWWLCCESLRSRAVVPLVITCMNSRRSSVASDGGKRQSSLLSFFKVLPKKEENRPSLPSRGDVADVDMDSSPATVER